VPEDQQTQQLAGSTPLYVLLDAAAPAYPVGSYILLFSADYELANFIKSEYQWLTSTFYLTNPSLGEGAISRI
jgi:hypothetical protein